jgi:hypothetical protein
MALYDSFINPYGFGTAALVGGITTPWTGVPGVGGITTPWLGAQPGAQVGAIGIPRPPGPSPFPMQPITVPGQAPPVNAAPVTHPEYGMGYNAPGRDLSKTALGRRAAQLNPEGVYGSFLAKRGMADQNTRLGQWSQNQFGHVMDLYKIAQLQDPGLRFDRFLKTGGAGKMMREFLNLSPSQRGARMPSRTSVVSWG